MHRVNGIFKSVNVKCDALEQYQVCKRYKINCVRGAVSLPDVGNARVRMHKATRFPDDVARK